MTNEKTPFTKVANQNIDVHFYQSREVGEWFARVVMTPKETFTIGPGDFQSVMTGVANLVGTEAAYADLKVHGQEAITERNKPRKRSPRAKAYADKVTSGIREDMLPDASDGDEVWVEACEEAYGRGK